MNLILNRVLFVNMFFFIEICKADDGLDLNVFQQHDYQLEFERAEIVRYNKDALKDASMVTFKYNRTIAVVNATYNFKIDVGNDMSSITQAYKFMSNEYREFPMRFALNACKGFEANVLGIRNTLKCGNFTGCPLAKGKIYNICNWYPDKSKLPPLIPNGQYKFEVQTLHFSMELGVINLYTTASRPLVNHN